MALTRRQFLTLAGGSAAGAILFQACGVPEDELLVQAPVEMPEDLVTGRDNWYATLCRQCNTSEGIVVRVMEGRAKKVEGNVDYPINQGKHSARCEASLQALYHPDRIRAPMVRVGERGTNQFREISWEDAIGRLAFQLQNIADAGRQSSVVLATDPVNAHLRMVVQSFVSAYGGRHMTYEPLERTTLRTTIRQVFGQDIMPDFDIANAESVLSFGADFLNTWVSPVRYASGYGKFREQADDGHRGTLIHVDSRFSMTAANADKWVYVKPGMEGVLALSIAQVIIADGLADEGAAQALTANGAFNINAYAPDAVANRTGVSADKIRSIAHDFAENRPALAFGGGSAAAHTNGLSNLAAIYSLNYLVGSVNREGGVIFNPASPIDDLPSAASGTAFSEWHRLADEMSRGDVQMLMVRGADPIYGLPDAINFKIAAYDVPYIVSFSDVMDDTTAVADLVLPQHNPLEDWGSDVPDPASGYELIGFQQPVVRPFFEARGDQLGTRGFADVLLTVAQGLELDLGLPGETFRDILKDGARQLHEVNRGSVRASGFNAFWNGVLQRGGWWDTSARSNASTPTPPALLDARDPVFAPGEFHLIPFTSTGLGDGKGAALPWMQATPDPISTAVWRTWVEINHRVAEQRDISEGDVISIESQYGRIEALAYPSPAVPPDSVCVPVGQGHSAGGRYAKGRGSNVYSILSPNTDSDTGALAWASTKVNIQKTGEWVRLPKFENTVTEFPRDEHQHVIKLTAIDGSGDGH